MNKHYNQTLRPHFSLSSICPGEPFSGYLARHRYMTPTSICKDVTGLNMLPSWVLPANIARFVRILGDRVGSPGDVLANNTLLPGYVRFLPPDVAQLLRQRHLSGSQRTSSLLLGMNSSIQRPVWNPAICLLCLKDDLTPNGMPFWRRDFLFSHVRFCSRHQTPLYEMCGACTHSHRHSEVITTPHETCICGKPLKQRTHTTSERAQEIELDIARGWSTLLDSSFAPRMQGPQFADLLQRVAREQGLLEHGRVQWQKYQALISDSARIEVIMSLRISVRAPSISEALKGNACPSNPFVAIFLLVTLFGSWRHAEAAIRSYNSTKSGHEAFEDEPRRPPGPPRKRSISYQLKKATSMDLLPQTSRLYNEMREANPHLSHWQVLHSLPSRNRAAATRALLIEHGAVLVPRRKGDERTRAVDESLTSHIERRSQELIEKKVPFRITAARLIHGHVGTSQGRSAILKFPKAAAALDTHEETNEGRYRRLIKAAIGDAKLEGLTTASAHIVDEMDLHRLKLVWALVGRGHENSMSSATQHHVPFPLFDDVFAKPRRGRPPRDRSRAVHDDPEAPSSLPETANRSRRGLLPSSVSWSAICPGEPLPGYLARQRYIAQKSICLADAGLKMIPSWILPTQIEEYVRLLGDHIGSVDDVLNQNTLLPGYTRFLNAPDASELRRRHIHGPQRHSASMIGLTHGIHRVAWNQAVCLSCLQEDLSPEGMPFWRKDFLFTYVRFCAKHEAPLYELCSTCASSSRNSHRITVPQDICLCGSPLRVRATTLPQKVEELEIGIARAWSTLLDHTFAAQMQGPQFAALFRCAAIDNEVVKKGRVQWREYWNLLSDPARMEVANRLGITVHSQSTMDTLLGLACPKNPFVAIFMLLTLFGSWESAKLALTSYAETTSSRDAVVAAQACANKGQPDRRKRDASAMLANSIALLPETCRLYRAAHDANPHLSHTQIIRLLPQRNRRAATMDRLREHGADPVRARMGAEHRDDVDGSLAAHIERRRKELIDKDVPFRICNARLLEDHVCTKSAAAVRAKFPRAAAALDKYVERHEAYYRRIIKSAIRAGKLEEFTPEEEHAVDDMDLLRVKKIWTRLRDNHGNP